MSYYKAFNPDLTCRRFKFEIGKTYIAEGTIEMQKNGFHCCEQALDCLVYYALPLRLCEVTIGDESITEGDKTVARQITIVREIVGEEFDHLLTGCIRRAVSTAWYRGGKIHRDIQPAIIWDNGREDWYTDGKLIETKN